MQNFQREPQKDSSYASDQGDPESEAMALKPAGIVRVHSDDNGFRHMLKQEHSLPRPDVNERIADL